jgi:PDZ domain-containing protein
MNDEPSAVPPPGPLPGGSDTGPPPPGPDARFDPVTAARRHRRHLVVAWIASIIGVLLVVAVVAGFLIRLPYVIISPGSSTPLDRSVVSVDGATTYPHRESVEFLTVRVSNEDPTLWRLVGAWLDSDRDVEKRSDVVGCLSDSDNRQFNADLMAQSQNDAKYVALTRLGYTVPADPARLVVTEVCKGVPAYGELAVGDRVVAVDGKPVAALSEIASGVQSHQPGDDVEFTVERAGKQVDVAVTTGRASKDRLTCLPVHDGEQQKPDAHQIPCVGITTQSFVDYTFPIDVTINTDRVGGPSAGLAFTLAIIDDLTPGSLTGGKRIAVTGTIGPDGKVGPVGGVEQKAITARTNDVGLMIVPSSEVRDARQGAGKVRVVGVDTLDEALAALARAGGSEVPPPSTTAARS